MRAVRIIQAVALFSPYVIVGDLGALLCLPDAAGEFAVTQGYAVDTDPANLPPPAPVQGPDTAGTLSKLGEESSQAEPEEPEEAEPPKKPYGNAPKSAWAAYAAAVDPEMTVERAEGLTKADLMSRYGERL